MLHRKNLGLGAMAALVTVLGVSLGGRTADDVEETVWVIHNPERTNERLSHMNKPERLSLMMYRCVDGGKSMRLVAARGSLEYDEELAEYRADCRMRNKDIYDELKAEVKKRETRASGAADPVKRKDTPRE
jgi:hypothetical protein